MTKEVTKLLLELFFNRKDVHAKQFLQKTGQKGFSCEKKPITPELVEKHLNDEYPLGTYQINKEGKVKWICFDYDENTPNDFEKAQRLHFKLKQEGFHPLAEKSGGGNYKIHIWIFCKETEAEYAKNWALEISKHKLLKPHEIFPKQSKIKEGEFGNLVKLPLGINLSTNNRSFFLDNDFKEIIDLDNITKILKFHFDNPDDIPKIEIKHETTYFQIETSANEFDNFFNYVINNELPKGISVEEKVGSITGINDNILKNEAAWFYKKGYTLERLENEIKPIFEKRGWTFSDLKGWFNKAVKGDIKEIGKGELVNWCKTYYPDLLKLLPQESPYLEKKDLVYKTNHLPSFNDLNEAICLYGDEYRLFKKDAYNLLISLACPEHLLKIKIGQIETDLRIHPLFVIPSGKGKLEIKEGIKKIYKRFKEDGNIKEPRTIHYQQLIGKVLKRKEKDENGKPKEMWIKKFGYLFSDLLILEEAYEIFTSKEKNDVDSRDALIVGLDIYKKNLIQKQNIDNLDNDQETIEGYPHVRCLAFTQPLNLPEKFITKGIQRRFSVNYNEFPKRTPLDKFASRLNACLENEESINNFSIFMRKINQITDTWCFEKNSFEAFLLCHTALLEQGYSIPGKTSNFTNIIEFPLQNLLLKVSALRALSHFRTTIKVEDILDAYMDIVERFVHELDFVDKKVQGSFDYGASWGGALGKEKECLEWLNNRGADSKENSTTFIQTFQRKISDIFDISNRRARDKYSEMKDKGLISDYKGVHESKVWLNFKPKTDEFQSGKSGQSGHLSKTIYNLARVDSMDRGARLNQSNKLFYKCEK